MFNTKLDTRDTVPMMDEALLMWYKSAPLLVRVQSNSVFF